MELFRTSGARAGMLDWKITADVSKMELYQLIDAFNKAGDVVDVNKRTIKKLNDLSTHDELVDKYLDIIQSADDDIDILTTDRSHRFVIYMLCTLLKRKYKRIDNHTNRYVDCREFIPPWDGKSYCGCDYAPAKFHKRHYTTGRDKYDYDFHLSFMPYTEKLGVTVFK